MSKAIRTDAYIPGECWETYGSMALGIFTEDRQTRNSTSNARCGATGNSHSEHTGSNRSFKKARRATKINRMGTIHFLGMIVVGCIAALLLYCNGGVASVHHALTAVQTEYITIDEGDSLWSIASDRPVQGLSTQEEVRWLVEYNKLESSALLPGQVLVVPVNV